MTTTPSNDHVRIFDTTLRDGEQSPGATLTSVEKLEIARQLASLGVDVMEAGFPASSPDDLRAVQRIAEEVGTADGPIICGLARANRGDVEKCWQGVQPAAKPRIHTFIACSDLHMERKLEMTREQVTAQVRDMVELARSYCSDVEFSPEDGSRADIDFLIEVLSVAIEAGATTINVPDTVGYATPAEYGALFRRLIKETNGADRVIWSAHCHDDLGMATANTLAALEAGARQAEVCVNGIGERAGNTSLEEIVMALHTRRPFYGLHTTIDTVQLARISKMVSNYTGIPVPPNKAIVGANAFAHEAGIHQDGMLKDHRTYEIMTPETVGLSHSKLVLGKHSGRHAFRIRLEELGHHLSSAELYPAFQRFKALAEKKKTVTDADLTALVASEVKPEAIYSLEDLQVTCGRSGLSTATVRLRGPGGVEKIEPAIGTGPVDAAFRAIDEIVQAPNTLVEYNVHSVTEGIDALGEVTVRIKSESVDAGRMFGGYGADTDVITASAQAYLAAINRLLEAQGRGSRGAREIGPATVRAAGAVAAKVAGEAS
jgi:2-isopropylmalate synthase